MTGFCVDFIPFVYSCPFHVALTCRIVIQKRMLKASHACTLHMFIVMQLSVHDYPSLSKVDITHRNGGAFSSNKKQCTVRCILFFPYFRQRFSLSL
jgi:hypothetical protein